MRSTPLLAAVLLFWGGAALAQDKTCVARVNHLEVVIDPATLGADAAAPTRRERLRDWPARRWNRALGRAPACDSQTTIAFLASYLELSQTEGYCLAEDPEAGYLLVPGARNYRGRCTVTACARVNMARDETLQAAGRIAGIVTGQTDPQPGTQDPGLAGLAHGSGAMLLSGNATSLASALGGAASSVATALSAPAVAAAAAVSVVAVGGAVYVCND